MPYIGNTPADKFLTLAKQSFSTSATTSYTLDSSISSTQDIALFINNVRQSPVDAYTVSGTALTLTSATAGTDEMYCVYLGKTVGTVSPASDSIATAMLQANSVTGAKLNDDVISSQTAITSVADTDELLVSDAGVLKRVDYSYLKAVNTPVFQVYLSTTQAISHDTATKVALDGEVFDPSGVFASNKFTVADAGYYAINAQIHFGCTNNNLEQFKLMIYVNGSKVRAVDWNDTTDGTMRRATISTQQIFNLSASDYVELYGLCYANDGTTTGYQFYSDGAECDTSMSAYKLIT